MPIDAIDTSSVVARAARTGSTPAGPASGSGGAASSSGFADSLIGMLESADRTAGDANTAIANMVRGTGDVHEAMIALQRAETALQLTVQVRNKLMQAYQDVMRMPI
ncbi:MAG: flagellar hook-basal body complex protein FliE [Acidobacteriota bacterium]|nr:flagellar hook-basal body complex protein FliE [Acidobacteriota bacterium]